VKRLSPSSSNLSCLDGGSVVALLVASSARDDGAPASAAGSSRAGRALSPDLPVSANPPTGRSTHMLRPQHLPPGMSVDLQLGFCSWSRLLRTRASRPSRAQTSAPAFVSPSLRARACFGTVFSLPPSHPATLNRIHTCIPPNHRPRSLSVGLSLGVGPLSRDSSPPLSRRGDPFRPFLSSSLSSSDVTLLHPFVMLTLPFSFVD
jgi:hypothetical protein